MEINFTEDQTIALQKMKEFISSSEDVMLLQGYAGTGKTTILREFISYLDEICFGYVLCAPTHKARSVMEKLLAEEAITLHRLLCMSPNISILELDLRDLEFYSSGTDIIPKGVIIVDESSMITNSLYDLLLKRCKAVNTKIIFVGDIAQLQPVGLGTISKVFLVENCVTLSKIHRQSSENALLPLLLKLRRSSISRFDPMEADEGSLITYNHAKTFMLEAGEYFKDAVLSGDVDYVKLLAYTRKRVFDLNKCMRRVIWRNLSSNEYNLGEFLTGYDNFKYLGYPFNNSSDYRIMNTPVLINKKLPNIDFPIPGYMLELEDSNSRHKGVFPCFIISRDIDNKLLTLLCRKLETLRINAVEASNSGNKTRAAYFWREYYKLNESFATPLDLSMDGRVIKRKTFDYGYALTVHKSQGCSLNRVFIDMSNVFICRDPQELRQLQYVGLSRTRTDAHLLL